MEGKHQDEEDLVTARKPDDDGVGIIAADERTTKMVIDDRVFRFGYDPLD